MRKTINRNETSITTDFLESGESIEEKMRRVTTSNEPIENISPMIYTERKQGVLPEYDIRTDRWEIAQNAMDKVTASKIAKRENKGVETEKEEVTYVTE